MENFDPTVLEIDNQTEYEYQYLQPFFDQIKKIDIQDFDFDIFKKYISELDNDEFEKVWEDSIAELLKYIDENYLVVDIDEFETSETDVMQTMFIEYIEFLMSVLPYKVIFAKYLKKTFKDLTSLDKWLSDKNISNDLKLLLEEDIRIINNMYEMIKTTITGSKKSSDYSARINKLKSYINYECNFRDYFIAIVEDSDNEMLKNLILAYYSSEYTS